MSLMRLSSLTSRLVHRNILKGFINSRQTFKTDKIPPVNSNNSDDYEDNEPIKYSTSKAAAWTVEYSQTGTTDDVPRFQPYVVGLSTIIFLVYFCILRESNDIDEILAMELGSHIDYPQPLQKKK